MKKVVTGVMIALVSLSLAACNTIRGVGQDIESVGETVEDAAT